MPIGYVLQRSVYLSGTYQVTQPSRAGELWPAAGADEDALDPKRNLPAVVPSLFQRRFRPPIAILGRFWMHYSLNSGLR